MNLSCFFKIKVGIFVLQISLSHKSHSHFPHFRKVTHAYPTKFANSNFMKAKNSLCSSKYRISVRGPDLWNKWLSNNERQIQNPSLFKSKVKSKLLSLANETTFF